MLRRVPIRLKLTVAFALAMGVVLQAVGLFVYLRMGSALDRNIDQSLRSRAGDITALIQQADQGLAEAGRSPLAEQGEGFAQVLDRRGRIVDSTPQVSRSPVLSPAALARAERATTLLTRGDARLLATPVDAQDRHLVVVVGASTRSRSEALNSLLTQLLIGGAVALALAAAAGYGVAAGALRPVETMRITAARSSCVPAASAARWSCTWSTPVAASPTPSCPRPSSASAGPKGAATGQGPGSAWRSRPRSPPRTAVAPARSTGPAAGRMCGSRCRRGANRMPTLRSLG